MSEELLEQAVVIRDETASEANTAARIGKLFVDIIQKMAKNLNADAVTFKGSATGMDMVFSGEEGDVFIPLPVVDVEKAGVITPAMMNGISDEIIKAVSGETNRALEAEKILSDGIGAIRGASILTAEGDNTTLTLKLVIGRGSPITLSLPVHGEEEWNVPADTPALIDPWTFQEVMGLFDTLENEAKRAEAAEKANAEAISSVAEAATTNNQILVSQGKSIDALIAQTGSLQLTVTPNVVFRNVPADVTVKAVFASTLEADVKADIRIMKGDDVVARDTDKAVSWQESLVAVQDVVYGADTYYSGKMLAASKTLQVVDPVYAGAGAAHTDIILDENKQTVRTSAAGTYNVTVANDGDYVWLLVPRGFAAIKKATLSGFDFPLETPTVVYIGGSSALTGGIAYSCYRSSNQYAAGNLSIVIS